MSLTVIVFATIVSPVPDSEEGRWADLREASREGGGGCEGRVGSSPGRQAGTWDWVRVWTPDQLSCHKKRLTFLSFTFALTMDSKRRKQRKYHSNKL